MGHVISVFAKPRRLKKNNNSKTIT